MAARLELPESPLAIQPGTHVDCRARVCNIGFRQDRFMLELAGAAASWATIEPPVVTLAPGDVADVRIRFHPPRSSHVRAGAVPFALLATSERDLASVMTEQLLAVSRFVETVLELRPVAVRRRLTRYVVDVENRGNDTVRLALRGRDVGGLLDVVCEPAEVAVLPGLAEQVAVHVRMRNGTGAAGAEPVPFQVVAQAGGEDPIMVTGLFRSRPCRFGWMGDRGQMRPSRTA